MARDQLDAVGGRGLVEELKIVRSRRYKFGASAANGHGLKTRIELSVPQQKLRRMKEVSGRIMRASGHQ